MHNRVLRTVTLGTHRHVRRRLEHELRMELQGGRPAAAQQRRQVRLGRQRPAIHLNNVATI